MIVILLLCSCAKKVLPPAEWVYEENAIKLEIKSDPMLNLYEGKAHTLYACIYQLKTPNGFNQLINDQKGLYKLLDCKIFDSSVALSKSIVVNPDKDTTLFMDRAEGAIFLAVVAGYYAIEKDRIARLIENPVFVEKKGWILTKKTKKPSLLNIELKLGSNQIKNIKIK